MARHRILAIGLVLAASMPRPDVLARVAGDDQQIALAVDSSADKSGSKSVLNDLFAAPVVRDLIARGVLGGLGAAYDFNFVGDTQLVVFVNPGVDDSGASRLSVARAELPGTYKGLRVVFIPTPVADRSGAARAAASQNGKISDREIQQAQQGLLGISAMPGSRSLIQNRTITSIFIDYADSPPELCVSVERDNAGTLEDVERQIPSSYHGLPVLVSYVDRSSNSSVGHWGSSVDPNRPGRRRQTDSR